MHFDGAHEELGLTLLGGYVHDVGSPLAALASNVEVARDLLASRADADEPSNVELREILDDIGSSTARLTELSAALRMYVGMPAGTGTCDEIARVVLRLARAHVTRRADVELAIDPSLRVDLPPGLLARTLGEILVALTNDAPGAGTSARAHLRVSSDAQGLLVCLRPVPRTDPTDILHAAAARLIGIRLEIDTVEDRIELRMPLRWS